MPIQFPAAIAIFGGAKPKDLLFCSVRCNDSVDLSRTAAAPQEGNPLRIPLEFRFDFFDLKVARRTADDWGMGNGGKL
jgi:hypothetical protein